VADLDVDRGTLSVSRSTRKGITSPPKTAAGNRTVHLPACLAADLAAHVAGRSPSAPLFTTTTRTRLDSSNLLRRVRATADGLGLPPLRVHDLRHTGISLALAGGVPVKDVSAWCGHKDASVTLKVYAHAVPGREAVVADTFNAMFSGNVVPLRSVAS
jgi:integrase